MEKIEKKGPVIVAMKGRSLTGKTTLARALTKAIGCPLIGYDDVCSSTVTLYDRLLSASINPTDAYNLLDELSYEAVFQIALTQLSLPHPLSVVIDSPLSGEAHLTRLQKLASQFSARLFIVECKPENEVEWRRRFEEPNTFKLFHYSKWYKPSNWEQLQLASPEYYDDDDDVTRIVIDTTSLVKIQVHVAAVLKLIGLETTDDDDDDDHVSTTVEEGSLEMKTLLDKHEHPMTLYDVLKEGEEHPFEAHQSCAYCFEYDLSGGPIYSCAECPYTLHKMCAEFPLQIQVPLQHHPLPLDLYTSLTTCAVCGDINRFGYPLYECRTCNLHIHPKCGLAQTNLTHGLHIHPLDIQRGQLSIRGYRCLPLDFKRGQLSIKGYRCLICARHSDYGSYSCVDCDFHIHPWCALLPLTAKHDRHLHILTLGSAPRDDDSDDEYYCNACEQLRDPNQYVYYCAAADCEFAAHLTCILPSQLFDPQIIPWYEFVAAKWVDIQFPEAAS